MRALVHETFESITIYHSGIRAKLDGPRPILVLLTAANGVTKELVIDRKTGEPRRDPRMTEVGHQRMPFLKGQQPQ